MTTPHWRAGNHVELLENGEELYPRVFQAIEEAKHQILIETFILGDDKVGHRLARSLAGAVERGVRVELTADAWGSRALSREFIQSMTTSGICLHLFENKRPRWLLRVSYLRRLHRKIVVVDGQCAFIGGLNFSEDHLRDYGADAKEDFSVVVTGPVVHDMQAFALAAIRSIHPGGQHAALQSRFTAEIGGVAGGMEAMFIPRDNRPGGRTSIEKDYCAAIGKAERRVIIANAYFFPGYRLLREIRNAARRGVDVRLIVQGEPDVRAAIVGARLLYDYLIESGVSIYEFAGRQFHAKVALVDDDWTTVGSSNLDPLSLWFNLEANLVVRDARFNRATSERIEAQICSRCHRIDGERRAHQPFWRPAVALLALSFLRWFPYLAERLPAHPPRLTLMKKAPMRSSKGSSDQRPPAE